MKNVDWVKWAQELDKRITEWLVKESTDFHCNKCHEHLMQRTVYCSLHEMHSLGMGHGGFGKVHTFIIPECPTAKCPNHRPSFWDEHLSLNEASDTLYGPCWDT